MARKPRLEYPGGLYHLIARGNQRHVIFHDDADRRAYLQRVARYKTRYGFLLFAYTVMSNHVHLLVERQSVPLAKICQGLHQSYTQYYNRRYGTVGHVFQGRYKAILCDRETYWLALVRYIHLNAVRAKVVADPGAYPWSSHQAYVGRERSRVVDTGPVLAQFGGTRRAAQRAFAAFVQEEVTGPRRPEYYPERDQRVLGDEGFVARVTATVKQPVPQRPIQTPIARRSASSLLEAVAEHSGVAAARILGRERAEAVVRARRLLVLVGARCAIPGRTLAQLMNRDPAVISRMAKAAHPQQHEQAARLCQTLDSQYIIV
ncbi:MAG: transposase [Nitrospirota bacterium]